MQIGDLYTTRGLYLYNYCNWKLIGTVYSTLTGFPLCVPGFQFGINCRTRMASRSNKGSTLLAILKSTGSPSLLMIKVTKTFPCNIFFHRFKRITNSFCQKFHHTTIFTHEFRHILYNLENLFILITFFFISYNH